MKHIGFLFAAILVLLSPHVWSQEKDKFLADFSIIEKNEITLKNQIVNGKVEYIKSINQTILQISFPQKEKWILKDSILTKYLNDTLVSRSTSSKLDELSIFGSLLEMKSQDFGLKQMGFTITNTVNEEGTIYLTWAPSQNFKKFVKTAKTAIKSNLLHGVILTDSDDIDITSIFFEGYKLVSDLPIPHKITQLFQTKQSKIYKSISFYNVKVQ